jgi:hypothetical protein
VPAVQALLDCTRAGLLNCASQELTLRGAPSNGFAIVRLRSPAPVVGCSCESGPG